ncbi:hypothetical protein [Ktedonospora formicarum]|uniref:Uncharacterized protein n=1 Tax=Ktedonospora formicarum TaxID=2778364 RepID=A0A8J3MQL4_9CHLR|nr:hypothetical protein [Ktedonospora formicarum]GHO42896.1 hypothetical protein KSX_10590 [Ktedonospora formicarum]
MAKFWGIIIVGIFIYAVALIGAIILSRFDPLKDYRWKREKSMEKVLLRFGIDYAHGLLIGLFFVLATIVTGGLAFYTTKTSDALPHDMYIMVSELFGWFSNGFFVIAGLTALIWVLGALGTTIVGNKGARGRGLGLLTSLIVLVWEYLYGHQWYQAFLHWNPGLLS